jgi:hypothetical protein
MLAGCSGQPGQRRLERQFLGPARVHPAEQGIDQPVHHFLAEPGGHVAGHRHVAVAWRGGQFQLTAGAVQPVRGEQTGLGQLSDVRGHAHVLPGWQAAHRAPGPDPRRGGPRPDEFGAQPGRADQVRALRTAGQQGLGPHVHTAPGHLGHGQLAAQPGRSLQDDGLYRLIAQEERGSQAGDAATDDRDDRPRCGLLHAFTLVRVACAGCRR